MKNIIPISAASVVGLVLILIAVKEFNRAEETSKSNPATSLAVKSEVKPVTSRIIENPASGINPVKGASDVERPTALLDIGHAFSFLNPSANLDAADADNAYTTDANNRYSHRYNHIVAPSFLNVTQAQSREVRFAVNTVLKKAGHKELNEQSFDRLVKVYERVAAKAVKKSSEIVAKQDSDIPVDPQEIKALQESLKEEIMDEVRGVVQKEFGVSPEVLLEQLTQG